eukprot:scaffold313476_cov14-Tisochrysis_lutea.AAC.1
MAGKLVSCWVAQSARQAPGCACLVFRLIMGKTSSASCYAKLDVHAMPPRKAWVQNFRLQPLSPSES